jgi:hypothetical protein
MSEVGNRRQATDMLKMTRLTHLDSQRQEFSAAQTYAKIPFRWLQIPGLIGKTCWRN